VRRAVAAVAMASALAGPPGRAAPAEGEARPPFELVRTLQVMQSQSAAGNADAHRAIPGYVTLVAERFAATDAEVWRNPKNARAAVVFILSGGQARAMRRILDLGTFPKDDESLMRGALAYVEGKEAQALLLWAKIDPRALEPSLGGLVALIQAALVLAEDRPKALKLLDLARLVMPGTLVEEAALRRKIFLVDEAGEPAEFLTLSRQYVRRFQRSVFAANFKQRFAASAAAVGLAEGGRHMPRIEHVLAELPAAEQRDVHLMIAQAALLGGKVGPALFAAGKARALAAGAAEASARATLYAAAAMILTDAFDQGKATLEGLDPGLLPAADDELRQAALQVAKEIRDWPDPAAAPGAPPGPDAAGAADKLPPSPAMRRAEDAIASADAILARAAP
jgi:chemotaxis protein MotC